MPALPTPALVVLVGPSGSGKSTWARKQYATNEVVSSDALRAVVGSGEGDLDASADAFAVLDTVVSARLRRGLTTVVDTLGLDQARRVAAVSAGRTAGLPVVAIRFTTGLDICRRRNRERARPVPAPVLKAQFQRAASADLEADGFDLVVQVDAADADAGTAASDVPIPVPMPAQGGQPALRFALQVSSFPWGQDPRRWLRDVARAAEDSGFTAVAVMDHLLQIPQVGRAWDPIPEAYVTLGYLAGVTERVELGALVTPVTFRAAPLLAKMLASLDVVSGGRAFCGIGAGWYGREHAGYGLPFPTAGARLDALEATIGVLRAFWGPGTKPYEGLPETTCYPRPGPIPIIVGGGGERRTLEIAARLGDGCNVSSAPGVLDRKLAAFRDHAERSGRSIGIDPRDDLRITVLDLPIVGDDPDEVGRLVEAHRGRTSATAYAAAHHAGTVERHIERYRGLADLGVHTVFVSFPNLAGPAEVERFAAVTQAFATDGDGAIRTG
ncbi:LLM class flavin-dependent oxidoreductase [Nakamurella sp. GG22]